jgi:hypothetical protein
VVMSASLDRGRSFSKPVKLNDHKGQTPAVAVNAQGRGAMTWSVSTTLRHRPVAFSERPR